MSHFFFYDHLERVAFLPEDWKSSAAQSQGPQVVAGDEKGCVKVAGNLHRWRNSPNLYIVLRQGGRERWKSTKTSSSKEAKRLRDEFLTLVRAPERMSIG